MPSSHFIVFTCAECGKLRESDMIAELREDGQLVGICCADHELEYTYEDM